MITLQSARGMLSSVSPRPDRPDPSSVPPREVPIRLLPKQYDFVRDRETFLLALIGGVGAGKTFSLTVYIACKFAEEAGTGTLGSIYANTYKQLNQTTLPKLWEMFDTLGMKYGADYVYNEAPPRSWVGFKSRFRKKFESVLSVRRWGQAITRSLDNFASLRGAEVGWGAMDESRDTKKEAFQVVLARIRCPKARHKELRITTSPNGYDWLWEIFEEKKVAGRRYIQVDTRENTFLSPEYAEGLLASYDPKLAEQEVAGKFVSVTRGRVYPQFNRDVHADAAASPDRRYPFSASFDFNRVPYCVVVGQVVPDPRVSGGKRAVVLDEVRLFDATTDVAVAEVVRRITDLFHAAPALPNAPTSISLDVYGDPAGLQHTTKANVTDYDIIWRDTRAAFGNLVRRRWRASDPGIANRVNAVNAAFRNSLGETRLSVHPRCKYLIADLERVAYKEGSRQIDKESDKMITHLSDALAYWVVEEMPIRVAAAAAMVSL